MAAEIISRKTGADIFEIKTEIPYPQSYNAVVAAAKKEQENGARPRLAAMAENISDYDVVFLGYPNWWGTIPMPIFTFLESASFSGKTILPFCTHGGGGLGRSEQDIKAACRGAAVEKGLAIQDGASGMERLIDDWIRAAGL